MNFSCVLRPVWLACCLAIQACLFPAYLAAQGLPYRQQKDVVFAEVHGAGLLMDVFRPEGKTNGLAIVDVVSGAWYSDRNKIRDHTLAQLYSTFCGRGYVVFAARPGSKTRYTAAEMVQHVELAIRYAKEHAEEYHIDPDRLGLTGASAGGHLATLTALAPRPGKPEAKLALERQSTAVKAVGVFFPPTDFLDWSGDGKPADPGVLGPLLFVGGSQGRTAEEIQAQARAISPFHQVKGRPEAPFFLIHGDADKVVPLSHSRKLVEAIQAAGGDARLLVKAGGGHPWMTLPEEVKVLADWFDERLGQTTAAKP
jgi:acetyl esterase/lipase